MKAINHSPPGLVRRFRNWINRLVDRWLAKRIPGNDQINLTQKNIFILPNRQGLSWLSLCGVLFVLGTNYQNNLILLLTWFLMALLITSVFFCFFNLHGLTIKRLTVNPVYAGNTAMIPLQISGNGRAIHQLNLQFANNEVITVNTEDVITVNVPYNIDDRGVHYPPRLLIQTQYPLGLIKSWSRLDLAVEVIAWPRLLPQTQMKQLPVASAQHRQTNEQPEDFDGIREFKSGDSLNQIAWKHVAKGQGSLVSKTFESDDAKIWLNYAHAEGRDLEEKLSHLATAIVNLAQQSTRYGLILPNQVIPADNSLAHQHACLNALARFKKPVYKKESL